MRVREGREEGEKNIRHSRPLFTEGSIFRFGWEPPNNQRTEEKKKNSSAISESPQSVEEGGGGDTPPSDTLAIKSHPLCPVEPTDIILHIHLTCRDRPHRRESSRRPCPIMCDLHRAVPSGHDDDGNSPTWIPHPPPPPPRIRTRQTRRSSGGGGGGE